MTSSITFSTESEHPLSPRQTLPTMYDLPSENPEEPGLPDLYHSWQSRIFDFTLQPINWDWDEVFSAADLNVYYDVQHTQWYKRPDWFCVVGVRRFYEDRDLRLSYVIWQEGVSPLVVVELLSPGTEDEDLGRTESQEGKPPTKWEVYEQILRIPYYFVFSRYTNEVQAFRLLAGSYEPWLSSEGRWYIPQLGISLGLWEGSYRGWNRIWMRWFTAEGELIPLPEEQAAQAMLKMQKLAEQLRDLGINPDEI